MNRTTIDDRVDPLTLKIAQLSTMRASAVCVRDLVAAGEIEKALAVLDTWITSCTERLEDLGVAE